MNGFYNTPADLVVFNEWQLIFLFILPLTISDVRFDVFCQTFPTWKPLSHKAFRVSLTLIPAEYIASRLLQVISFRKLVSFTSLFMHHLRPSPSKYTFQHFQGCTVPCRCPCHRMRQLSARHSSWSQERQNYFSSTAITSKMLDFSTISGYINQKNPTQRPALPYF